MPPPPPLSSPSSVHFLKSSPSPTPPTGKDMVSSAFDLHTFFFKYYYAFMFYEEEYSTFFSKRNRELITHSDYYTFMRKSTVLFLQDEIESS